MSYESVAYYSDDFTRNWRFKLGSYWPMSYQTRCFSWLVCFCIGVSGLFSLKAEAQEPAVFPEKNLQGIVDRLVQKGIPGVVLALGDGKERWAGASGVADISSKRPMTPDCQIRIASVTKALAALVAWKLIEIHELDRTSKVGDFLKRGLVPQEDRITVSMLLNHTSGIYDHENDEEFVMDLLKQPSARWSSDRVLAISRKHGLDFSPGTGYAYSNTGYYVLGMILEKATHKTPQELFEQFVLRPTGLSSTSLNPEGFFTTDNKTPGYSYLDTGSDLVDIGKWNFSWDWTAGSAVTTATDMIGIASALMEGAILSSAIRDDMWTVQPPSRDGFGFEMWPPKTSSKWVCKSGCNPGTTTLWMMCPEKKRSFFLGCNLSDLRSDPKINTNQLVYNAAQEILQEMGWE